MIEYNDGEKFSELTARRSKTMVTRVSAVGSAAVMVGLMTMSISRAAFVATTDTTGNSASTGDLTLTDNDASGAMFSSIVAGAPGDSEVSCIDVSYAGDFDPTMVKLYTAGTTGDIADNLELTIEVGSSAAGFDNCTGFSSSSTIYAGTVGDLDSAHTNYANGIDTTFDPDGSGGASDTRSFRFVVEVGSAADGAGQSGTFGFVWETQSA